MIKRCIYITILCIALFSMISCDNKTPPIVDINTSEVAVPAETIAAPETTSSPETEPIPETEYLDVETTEHTIETITIELEAPTTIDEALTKLYFFKSQERTISDYINNLILSGYGLNDTIMIEAQKDHYIAQYSYGFYVTYWNEWSAKYATACTVWKYLRQTCGYSEAVAAGILGNMMVECADKNLDLNWNIYNKSKTHYGICQWSKKYYPEIQLASLEKQLDFLAATIEEEINTFANNYKKKFSYTKFIALTNEKDVALAFAKCYERCGTGSYSNRQNFATIALNYFTKEVHNG